MTPARWFPRIKWTFIVAFRYAFGRWYIFRDAPDWFVAEASHWEGAHTMSEQACDEMRLRLERLVRDAEARVKATANP